jgi:hypothetical protein
LGGNLAFALYVVLNPGWRDPLFSEAANHFRARADATPERHTLVFLGSSRTGSGIDPRLVEPVVAEAIGTPCIAHNLHVLSAGPISQRLHLERLRNMHATPDWVVLELSPLWFAETDEKPYEYGNPAADRLAWDELALVASYGFPEGEYTRDWLAATTNPFTGFRFHVLNRYKPRWLPPKVAKRHPSAEANHGYRPAHFAQVTEEQRERGLHASAELFRAQLPRVHFTGAPANAFRDLVRICRSQRIAVGVFVPPEASSMRAWYTPELNDRLAAFLGELAHAGCCVADLRSALPDEAFHDGHHAVREFAPAYTQAVLEHVVLPLPRHGARSDQRLARRD